MTDRDDDPQYQVRKELKAHKKERILETATRLFYESGFRATSMESIADELSATKPFIYYHFKNKYDLLEEIALRVTGLANGALEAAIQVDADPGAVLANMVRNYSRLVLERKRIVAVFWREASNFTENTKERVEKERLRFTSALAEVLREGNARGVFEVDQPALTALAIMNLITFTYTWQHDNGELTQEDLCDQFVKLTLRMVVTKTQD
ncbi:MAG TPA: TetR/AcrR family transcriptional regulator [Polyangiales bacterium]|nr:TetR/AcrR family transcriptional regulator [Polyangiales bacterium]